MPENAITTPFRSVFLHIPKTGGTSLHQMLLPFYPKSDICPERYNHLDKKAADELSRYQFFSGHFDRHNVNLVPGPKRVVAMLREPRRRIISLYRFWRAHTWETIEKQNLGSLRIAKSLDFKRFLTLDDQGIPGDVDNILTRTLLGRISVTGSFPHRSFIYPDDEVVGRACEYLDSLNAYAIMEVFDETVPQLFQALDLPMPKRMKKTNTADDFSRSPRMEPIEVLDIDTECRGILDQLTWADRQVYDYAFHQVARHLPPLPLQILPYE